MLNLKEESKNKGITLIALVITIIVLLILAGISISMLSGDNSILQRAAESKEKTEIAQAIEQAKIDIIGESAEQRGKSIKADKLKEILKRYFRNEEVEALTDFSDLSQTVLTKLTGYEVMLSKIIDEIEVEVPTYAVYALGEEVSISYNGKTENFFVIEENDTANRDKITLITKYNLSKTANEQQNATDQTTGMAFCTGTKGYWVGSEYPYDDLNGLESETAIVYNKAKSYANMIKTAKGNSGTVEGRLLTKTEAENLKATGKIPKIIFGKDYSIEQVKTDNFLIFWLGTAANINGVYVLDGEYGEIYNLIFNSFAGVRPVLTVSKSLIS